MMNRMDIARNLQLRGVTVETPKESLQRKFSQITRQCVCLALVVTGAVGCGDSTPPTGAIGHVRAYFGGVASDEPEATLIAHDVLSAGGSAVDAVVAMGLTMMVTRPDAAGAGGGGICLVFNAKEGNAEAIEFFPRRVQSKAPAGRWLAATPGSFRGLYALHARYGKIRWEQLVLPAERLARFGVRVPRVAVRSLEQHGKTVLKGFKARSVFLDVGGHPFKEGDILRQVDLSTTLGRLRLVGPGDFYSGSVARKFIEGVLAAGGWLTIEDLRKYRPKWVKAKTANFAPHDVFFFPSPAAGGEVAAKIWEALGDKNNYGKADDIEKIMKLAAAARAGYATTMTQPQIDKSTASAGALAVDRSGNSAACVMSMDRPFGSGKMAGDTGILISHPTRRGFALALSAMIVGNRHTKQTLFAATGSGDQLASSAMMDVALRILNENEKLENTLRSKRAAGMKRAKQFAIEQGISAKIRNSLKTKQLEITEVPRVGLVNVMSCPGGIVDNPTNCEVKTDPRGFGHAINAEY